MRFKFTFEIFVIFFYLSSLEALYRVQTRNEIKIPASTSNHINNSNSNNISFVRKNGKNEFKPLVALGSTCDTGCPGGCDVTCGSS